MRGRRGRTQTRRLCVLLSPRALPGGLPVLSRAERREGPAGAAGLGGQQGGHVFWQISPVLPEVSPDPSLTRSQQCPWLLEGPQVFLCSLKLPPDELTDSLRKSVSRWCWQLRQVPAEQGCPQVTVLLGCARSSPVGDC